MPFQRHGEGERWDRERGGGGRGRTYAWHVEEMERRGEVEGIRGGERGTASHAPCVNHRHAMFSPSLSHAPVSTEIPAQGYRHVAGGGTGMSTGSACPNMACPSCPSRSLLYRWMSRLLQPIPCSFPSCLMSSHCHVPCHVSLPLPM